jgi:hypothetical protein
MKTEEDLLKLIELSDTANKINRRRTIYRRRLIRYIRKNIDNYPENNTIYFKIKRKIKYNYMGDFKDNELIDIVKKIIGPSLAIDLIKKIHEEGEHLSET